MNTIVLLVSVFLWIILIIGGAILYFFLCPKYEKGIKTSIDQPYNSDCSIDLVVFEKVNIEEEGIPDVESRKLQ